MAEDLPVTIKAGGGGHIHPSIGQTKDGTLIVVYKGANVLMCSRSTDGGKTWQTPFVIPASTTRPAVIREVTKYEVYPGTVDVLPDDRVLVTWNYIADDKARDGYYERALLYSISSDQGRTWGPQELIGPVNGKHLGAVRHNVLPWKGGQWLLPLRDGVPLLFNPKARELKAFPVAGSDEKRPFFQQIVRTPKGTLIAMGMTTLRSVDDGATWKVVDGFRPVKEIDSAEGRFLTVLRDGRLLVTWGINKGNKGLSYNFSADDGVTWNNDRTIVLLPEANVQARYYSARTIQIDDRHVGTVYLEGGVKFLRVNIDRIAK